MAIRTEIVAGVFAVGSLFCGPAFGEVDAAGYYAMRCASCHGAKGEGSDHLIPTLAPALKGNPLVTNAPAAAIAAVIRKGRQGERRLYDKAYPNMPAFGPEAVPDVDALVGYLKGALQK
jgi:mono/diheme cytochrome c family protein